jgi:hypothetical protein
MPTIIASRFPYYIIHIPGRTARSERGHREYYPAVYFIVKIDTVHDLPYGRCIYRYRSGRNWREVRHAAKGLVEKLMGEEEDDGKRA